MPTPESELFLAKKPKVPPTFDGVNMLDSAAVADARDAIIREQWVKQMMQRLVREELGKCYVKEGVNHLEKCGRYRDRYLQLLKENRMKGYRGYQTHYLPGVDGPDGADVATDYPTVQQAKGEKGSEPWERKGLTSGAGESGGGLY